MDFHLTIGIRRANVFPLSFYLFFFFTQLPTIARFVFAAETITVPQSRTLFVHNRNIRIKHVDVLLLLIDRIFQTYFVIFSSDTTGVHDTRKVHNVISFKVYFAFWAKQMRNWLLF